MASFEGLLFVVPFIVRNLLNYMVQYHQKIECWYSNPDESTLMGWVPRLSTIAEGLSFEAQGERSIFPVCYCRRRC